MRKSVIVVGPDKPLGGLGFSDTGNKGQGTPAIDGENRTMWIFEPPVAV